MAKVAVVGVGAIGGVLAGLLQVASRHQITLCTRKPIGGLTVETPQGVVQVQAANRTDPSQAEPVDWVLVATKTYDAAGAAAWFPSLLGPDTTVAVIQNGVEHREHFAEYLDPARILPVIIDCPVERRPDRTVHQRGPVRMVVEAGAPGQEFAALFAGSTATIDLTADFTTAAWRKLCTNAAGAVSALTLKPVGVLRDEACAQLALDIVAECIAVGRAEGANLDDSVAQQVLAMYRAQPADSVNSLLADRLAGRPMEVDARNGVIVRRGEKHSIPTPLNRMTAALLTAMARDSIGPT